MPSILFSFQLVFGIVEVWPRSYDSEDSAIRNYVLHTHTHTHTYPSTINIDTLGQCAQDWACKLMAVSPIPTFYCSI